MLYITAWLIEFYTPKYFLCRGSENRKRKLGIEQGRLTGAGPTRVAENSWEHRSNSLQLHKLRMYKTKLQSKMKVFFFSQELRRLQEPSRTSNIDDLDDLLYDLNSVQKNYGSDSTRSGNMCVSLFRGPTLNSFCPCVRRVLCYAVDLFASSSVCYCPI